MSNNSAFSPFGPTYLVGLTPVQVNSTLNNNPTSYRVRNLTTAPVYFSWAAPLVNNVAPVIPTVTPPTAGNPSAFTLAVLGSSAESFSGLPPNAYFQANTAASLEITAGEGI